MHPQQLAAAVSRSHSIMVRRGIIYSTWLRLLVLWSASYIGCAKPKKRPAGSEMRHGSGYVDTTPMTSHQRESQVVPEAALPMVSGLTSLATGSAAHFSNGASLATQGTGGTGDVVTTPWASCQPNTAPIPDLNETRVCLNSLLGSLLVADRAITHSVAHASGSLVHLPGLDAYAPDQVLALIRASENAQEQAAVLVVEALLLYVEKLNPGCNPYRAPEGPSHATLVMGRHLHNLGDQYEEVRSMLAARMRALCWSPDRVAAGIQVADQLAQRLTLSIKTSFNWAHNSRVSDWSWLIDSEGMRTITPVQANRHGVQWLPNATRVTREACAQVRLLPLFQARNLQHCLSSAGSKSTWWVCASTSARQHSLTFHSPSVGARWPHQGCKPPLSCDENKLGYADTAPSDRRDRDRAPLSFCEPQSSVTGQTRIQHPMWALGICARFVWPSSVGQATQQSLPAPLKARVWGQNGKGSTLSWRRTLCSYTNADAKFWQTLRRSSVCCRANSAAQYHAALLRWRPSVPLTRADGEETRQDLDLSNCDGCEGNVASLTKASLERCVICCGSRVCGHRTLYTER